MYCPTCRVEYREGFTRCSDCDVELVNDLPLEQVPEYEKLVTVFEGDASSAVVARAAVEDAGIESWVKDEEVHGLFPSLGSTEVLVCEQDEEPALKALDTAEHCTPVPHAGGESTSRQPQGAPCADNGFALDAQRNKSSNTRRRQNETSEKGHRIQGHSHQGKRV